MNAKLLLKKDLQTISVRYTFIVDIDICQALGAVFKNPILRMLSEEIRQKSNLPLGCPLKKVIIFRGVI